jgi:hypothetical protein
MNQIASNGGSSKPTFTDLRFDAGFAPCWAGRPQLMKVGLVVGSLDGRLLFMDDPGKAVGEPFKVSASGEAINGVATLPNWVVASTRDEVNFWPLPDSPEGQTFGFTFPLGAHMVTATASGYIVAALGQTGIMAAKPPFGVGIPVKVSSTLADGLYVYRVVPVGSENGDDVLACALRTGGIATMGLPGSQESQNINTVSFEGLDFIDIAALEPGSSSRAAVALGLDGTLVLFRDIVHDKNPITLRYDIVEGIAYRVLSCRGDVYILTGNALYMLNNLSGRFLAGKEVAVDTQILTLSIDGVDANLAGEASLVLTTSEGVVVFDIDRLRTSSPQSLSGAKIQIGEPVVFARKGSRGVSPVREESAEMVGVTC